MFSKTVTNFPFFAITRLFLVRDGAEVCEVKDEMANCKLAFDSQNELRGLQRPAKFL